MKVICNGSNIRCYINDNLVINATDTTNSKGAIAFGSYATSVQYDNVKVTPIIRDYAETDTVVTDTTAPNLASNLASSSHTLSTWSSDPTVDISWTEPNDLGSTYYYYETAVDEDGNEAYGARGNNRMQNGTFTSGLTYWTAPLGTISTVTGNGFNGNVLRLDSAGNGSRCWISTEPSPYTFERYKVYVVDFTYRASKSFEVRVRDTGGVSVPANTGTSKRYSVVIDCINATWSGYYDPNQEHLLLQLDGSNGVDWLEIDDIEVREIVNHTVTTGLDGYSVLWDTSASTVPSASKTNENNTLSLTSSSLASGNVNYAHIRSVDNAGNWSATAQHLGPFWVDVTPPTGTTLTIGTPTNNSIPLTVSGASDAHSGLHTTQTYKFDRTSPGSATSGWQTGTTWTDTSLSPNTQYTYTVTSKDNVGNIHTTSSQSKYTQGATADIVEVNGRLTNGTMYEGDGFTFVFSSANLNSGAIAYYKYVWDTSASTSAAAGTTWSSGTLSAPNGSYTKANSKALYLHVLAYNADNTANAEGTKHYGPYSHINTSRKLKHGKWFDDDGTLHTPGN